MPNSSPDPFNLARFIREQERDYGQALSELRAGRKKTHWIWYVLPQMKGLGSSEKSKYFGLTGPDEARAYLAHPVLGRRLVECVEAISAHGSVQAATILGSLDATKYQSCLTLFEAIAGSNSIYARALQQQFAGKRDQRTLELIDKATRT
jgi:uncharacterized protein (DUF1810 family)